MNSKIKFYQNPHLFFLGIFLLLFVLQLFFWTKTETIKPDIYVVPPIPNKYSIEALSMGDKEFYFRILALEIQNSGDSFGRFTSLKKYDYNKLYQWFTFLDTLNDKSSIIPSIASYYYSQTPNISDINYIIRYLDEHSMRNIDLNWWWMYQATSIASGILKDKKLALDLAYKLSTNNDPKAPFWTKEYPAFIQANMGDDCAAFMIIRKLLQDNESGIRKITVEQMNFMRHFIRNRLGKLKEHKFDPRKCKI